MKTLLAIAILPFLGQVLAAPSTVAPVSFAWDVSAEENIAGYRMHFGTESGVYTDVRDVGLVPTGPDKDGVQSHLSGELEFEFGTTYFTAITAYNTSGLESDYSNEISFTTPTKPDAPTGLKVVVTIETSSNLSDWEPIASVSQEMKSEQFFRLKMELK